jgi:hypothetical protein
MVPRCGGSIYKQGRIGEDRGSKEMDGCPLTEGCKTPLPVDVASEGRQTNGEGVVATLSLTFRVLIMLNNCVMSSLVARVASTCSHSRTSRFWSHSASIVVEIVDFRECGGGRAGGGGCH